MRLSSVVRLCGFEPVTVSGAVGVRMSNHDESRTMRDHEVSGEGVNEDQPRAALHVSESTRLDTAPPTKFPPPKEVYTSLNTRDSETMPSVHLASIEQPIATLDVRLSVHGISTISPLLTDPNRFGNDTQLVRGEAMGVTLPSKTLTPSSEVQQLCSGMIGKTKLVSDLDTCWSAEHATRTAGTRDKVDVFSDAQYLYSPVVSCVLV